MTVMKLRTSVSLMCDTDECHQDILGEAEADAFSSAALVGWRLGDDCKGPHLCPECAVGRVPTQTIRNAMEQAGVLSIRTDRAVIVGESVYDPSGAMIGTATTAGAMGEMVEFTPSKETLEKMTDMDLRDQDTDPDTVPATHLPAEALPHGAQVMSGNTADLVDEDDNALDDADSIFGTADNLFGSGSWDPDA